MGTRNLTCLVKDSKYKVAQYGQWEGYPEGQGSTVLNFIKNKDNMEKLNKALSKVRFIDTEGQDKEFYDSYNENAPEWSNEPDNRTPEQKHWFESFISRNIGGEIFQAIINADDKEIVLYNQISFAADSLFCEWAYCVDLDKNTFEVYKGFNKQPLDVSERFASIKVKEGEEYQPVKLVKIYNLNELPEESEFIKECDPPEEGDEDG